MMPFQIGDIVVMRKPHACGTNRWQITRVGTDIGIKCIKCQHKVLIERLRFINSLKSIESSDQTGTV